MAIGIDTIARGLGAKGLQEANRANARLDALPKGLVYRGAVDYYNDLPSGAEVGDTYTVKYKGSSGSIPDGNEYAWGDNGGTNAWIKIGKDYESLPADPGGTQESLVTTGEKDYWNHKADNTIPDCPVDEDGVYILVCTVASGVRTYSWEGGAGYQPMLVPVEEPSQDDNQLVEEPSDIDNQEE